MNASRTLVAIALVAAVAGGNGLAQGPEPLAVVTHPDSSVSDLSLEEARELFLGTSRRLQRTDLIENEDTRDRFYDALLTMSVNAYKRHWIAMVLGGQNAIPPRTVDARDVTAEVARTRTAFSFMEVSRVDRALKVVTINGMRPNHPAYPLR